MRGKLAAPRSFSLAIILLTLCAASPAADLTGTWIGTHESNTVYCNPDVHSSGPMKLILVQSGTSLTGTMDTGFFKDVDHCVLQPGPSTFPRLQLNGSVDGNSFTAAVSHPDAGALGPLTGSVNENAMTFTWTLPTDPDDPDFEPANGPIDTIFSATLTRAVVTLPTVKSFTASPAAIVSGTSTTLSWETLDAVSVAINQGVGTKPVTGTTSVSPTTTTIYTLTATSSAGSVTAQTTVTVTPPAAPANVVVAAYPRGMLQLPGSTLPAQPYDSYTLKNIGATTTTITLTQTNSFFVQGPATFALAPNASQIVTIRSSAQPPGTYQGASIVSGSGVASGLTIPIRLLVVAAAPTAPLTVVPSAARRDLTAPAGQNPSGSVSFTNSGSSFIEGLVVADAPWIVPQQSSLFLGPSETKQLELSIDRTRRPDADAPIGGVTGSLSFRYVNAAASTGNIEVHASTPVLTTVSVVIVDVVTLTPTAGSVPPLPPGQVALFLTGATSRLSSFGDLSLANPGTTAITNLQLYFSPFGGAPGQSISVAQFPANSGIAFPGVLKNIFALDSQIGSLHVRGDVSKVSAVQTQTDAARGQSYAIPLFRSDQGYTLGEDFFLTGVQQSATTSTNLYLQEMTNQEVTAQIDFFNALGQNAAAPRSVTFRNAIELENVIPAGVTTIRVVHGSSAKINGYALVIDSATKDAFAIVQSVAVTDPMICPAFATDGELVLHLANASNNPIDVAVKSVPTGERRRATTHATTSNITIPPRGSQDVRVLDSGFVRITGSTALRATATTSIAKGSGRIGSGVPVLATSRALALAGTRRFAGIEDSVSASPLTYRTNLMLVETSGKSAKVRLTLHVTFAAGKVSGSVSPTREITVPAGNFTLIEDLAATIIGPLRSELGDLHNVILDVEMAEGAGSVIPFLEVIDKGTGDVTIRHE